MAITQAGKETGNLAGIAFMVVGIGFLSVMDGVAKWLVKADYLVVQILSVRGWIIVALLLAWMPRAGGITALRTDRKTAHVLRAVLGFGAPFFFFTSLKGLPLFDADVIFFGAPFIMTALSIPLLKERVGGHGWGAVVIGFLGVLVAARPGGGVFGTEALYAVAASISYAMLMLATRWLCRTESTYQLVFSYNLGVAVISSLALPFVWEPMPAADLGIVTVMGVLSVVGHVCMTRALALSPVGVLAPFEYTSLIWATVIGFLVWKDVPSGHVLAGALIIVLSGLYLFSRETRDRTGRAEE